MKPRTAGWLAWSLWVLFIACMVGGRLLEALNGGDPASSLAEDIALPVAFAALATVGAVLASRRPKNAIGWILTFLALGVSISFLTSEYAEYALVTRSRPLPGAVAAAWLQDWTWEPSVGLLAFLFLLFPNGRVPSPRWKIVAWSSAAIIVLAFLVRGFQPEIELSGPDERPVIIDNPIGIEGAGAFLRAMEPIPDVGLVAAVLLGVVSLIVRFRRTRGDERQQVKWFTYAAVLAAIYLPLGDLVPIAAFGNLSFAAVILLFPVAIAVAVLKYRLYDIDRIINRTLVYGLLTGVLVGVYVGAVIGLGAVARSISDEANNSVVVAVSTLAVAALFRPARGRIQGFIDRRFYRRKYDAARTLEAFTSRLREEVDLDTLTAELLGVVRETMQPAHASLWLARKEPVR